MIEKQLSFDKATGLEFVDVEFQRFSSSTGEHLEYMLQMYKNEAERNTRGEIEALSTHPLLNFEPVPDGG